MDHLPVNKNVKFAKLLSTNTRFANLSLLAAIAVATAGLVIVSGLAINSLQNPLSLSSLSHKIPQNPLNPSKVFADSASTPASSFAFAAYDRALASIQAQLTSVSSPAKLGKSGILTITDSGIIKPTDHNQTQGGIGTDVSRIGKIWGTFMDLNDDVSINGKLDLSGKLTANGVVTLGNNDGDTIEVGGRFTSNLVPSKNNDIDLGTTTYRFRTGYFVNSIVVGSGTTTITDTGITTTGGSSTTITSSLLNLVSTGTLQLDTSTNNNNILLLSGTGNVGIGSTAPSAKLDVVGDMALNGDLDFTGPQNITTTSDNLTISPTGNLIIDTSGGTLSIRDAAIDLTNQPTTISGSTLTLRSTGTFILDTSASNTNLRLQAGSGNVQVSSNQLYLTGNLVVTGTETFNGIAYTFPGTQTASGVLTTDGAGILSWGTIGAANITADSLDFTEFKDSMTLDADTSINGPYSFIIRAGQGSIENSTSGNNDLQFSAADKLILTGASFDLSTSNGAVDIISSQRLDLSAGGTLTLDTSRNNSHIVLTPGTGNIGIGSTSPVYKLDVNGTLRTSSTARIEGALTVTTGGAGITGDLTLDGDLDFTGPQNITTTSDDLTISPTGNLIIDTSGGTVSIRDAAIDLTSQPTTLSASTLTLRSTGTLIIDTSANNTDLRFQAGTGNVQVSSNQLYLTGNLVITGTETFNGVTYTFPGADGSASNVLTTSGAGLLSWGTLGATSITNDSLDFAQFDDSLDLDADTSINGSYSFILRAGNAARQNATSGSNDLQLSAEDQILIHGSALLLETSSASAGQLVIRSDGTLQLDTSANNTNIALQAGSGNINLSSTGTITLTGNTSLNNGTLRLNGLTYTFPGADTANGVLLSNGSGVLSWTTGLTGASLADDTLDFVDFQDELDLDADTSINGDYSLIVRAGLGSIQNSTSGSNDLQLSAEDKLILGAASFDLLTSSGAVDILSGSYLDLSSKGTLTLDTSQNNSNILLKAGSGSINLSSGTTTISGNLNLNSGTLTLNGVAYTFPGADGSASQALTTNASGILSWSTIGVSADSLDFTDLKDTLTMDSDTAVNGDYSFILRAGLGAVQDLTSGSNDIMAAAEDQMFFRAAGFNLTTSSASNDSIVLRSASGGIQLSTGSGSLGEMRLLSSGSLVLDTSLNNSNIRLQAGSGRIDLSGGTILVNSGTGTLTLSSESGVTVGGSLSATGNINSVDGGLQTNSVTRVSNSGAVSASALTMDTSPGKFTFQNGFYLQNISPTSLGMYDTGLNLVITFDEE